MDNITNISTALIFFSVFAFIRYIRNKVGHRHQTDANLPPCLPSLPVLGSLPFLPKSGNLADGLMKLRDKYGDVFSFYAGNKLTVVINGYELNREALVKRAVDFAGRRAFFSETAVSNPLRRGIIAKNWGESYKKYHQTTLCIFKHCGFGDQRIMEGQIHDEIFHLLAHCQTFSGSPTNPAEIFQTTVLNVIFNFLFGERFQYGVPDTAKFCRKMDKIIEPFDPLLDNFPILANLPSYRKLLHEVAQIRDELIEFFGEKIHGCLRRESMRDRFVNEFVKRRQGDYDETELNYILRDLIIAGSETSNTMLQWFVVLVGNHPDVQRRCLEEIEAVVPRDRLPFLDDKPKLPYTEATLLEVLRTRTLVNLGVPRFTTCDTQVGGFSVPDQTTVLSNIYSMHMDPQVWLEPEKFRPERFLDSDGYVTNRELMVAFSLGKRSCLGETMARQELFLVGSALIQNFEILPPVGETQIRDVPEVRVTTRPATFTARFVSRKKN